MPGEFETAEALKRAAGRVMYHLLRAAAEGLRAVEAVVEELGTVGKGSRPEEPKRTRIEVE